MITCLEKRLLLIDLNPLTIDTIASIRITTNLVILYDYYYDYYYYLCQVQLMITLLLLLLLLVLLLLFL